MVKLECTPNGEMNPLGKEGDDPDEEDDDPDKEDDDPGEEDDEPAEETNALMNIESEILRRRWFGLVGIEYASRICHLSIFPVSIMQSSHLIYLRTGGYHEK